jgi:hypothetical protein
MLGDISKETLYEGVKHLIDLEQHPHLHLNQHKLYTLYSIAFQYILYKSTKEPGSYIIRLEDSMLAEKLARKSKDQSTRRFLQTLLLPRKLKYGKSTFYLDFFHVGTWNLTKDIPPEKLHGCLIVKNTSASQPAIVMEEEDPILAAIPKDYYLTTMLEVSKRTLTIAFDCDFPNLHPVSFPFIKKDNVAKTVSGVTLSQELDWDNLD